MRLLVHVEGETEETFVNELLRDHLLDKGFRVVAATLVGKAGPRRQRGGIRPWPQVKRDLVRHLKEDPRCINTTMVDYYGMPTEGNEAWPGCAQAALLRSTQEKARCVQEAMLADVANEIGGNLHPRRFVPFVVMHEFEALLFSDCDAFSRGVDRRELAAQFAAIRSRFDTPEDIDDSPDTAPSKRIEALMPGYKKPLLGTLAALEIGLAPIRAECPHFDGWLAKLELLAVS